jgi:sugar lactone lactonase YvrE
MKRGITTALCLALVNCGPSDRDADDQIAIDTAAAVAPDAVPAAPMTVADVGLQTPESVLYDDRADMYLVSNINGEPLGRTGNGFITRLRPNGEVEQLKWIDGERDNVTLHAPKGMAFRGDTLFVSDIDSVRAFHRSTGAALGAMGVAGASFLNDVAVGPDGVYVTDTGVDASFAPTGTDAIHHFGAGGVATAVATGAQLARPNGIVVDGSSIIMVPFGSNTVTRVPLDGSAPSQIATLPGGQLDGLIRLDDGTLLVSSWEGSAVYRVSADGQVSTVVEDVQSPADLGWDSRRHRLLIPLFMGNSIEIREVH